MQAKSAAAYNEIRYDKKNWHWLRCITKSKKTSRKLYQSKKGFNHKIINELKNKIKGFSDIELFMVILFDEMKIQENLMCPNALVI